MWTDYVVWFKLYPLQCSLSYYITHYFVIYLSAASSGCCKFSTSFAFCAAGLLGSRCEGSPPCSSCPSPESCAFSY